jgi:hypothetical protein
MHPSAVNVMTRITHHQMGEHVSRTLISQFQIVKFMRISMHASNVKMVIFWFQIHLLIFQKDVANQRKSINVIFIHKPQILVKSVWTLISCKQVPVILVPIIRFPIVQFMKSQLINASNVLTITKSHQMD